MKRRKILVAALACIALLCITNFTYATIINSTNNNQNVSTSQLDIELVIDNEFVSENGKEELDFGNVVPGTVVDSQMAVKTGENSKEAYVRVTVNRYWSKDGMKSVDGFIDPAMIEIQSNSDQWIVKEDMNDNEVIYFYYRLPLKTNEVSDDFIDAFGLLVDHQMNSNRYSGYSAHVDCFAEGIQMVAAKEAMLAEWGVDATFNENNEIVSIVEQ